MWESPIYKFKTKVEGKEKEILIDVTGSAPTFKVPGKQLESAFDVLLKGLDPKKTKILDFGGAKLRNTIYLLEEGFTVYACEFEDLFKRSKQADELLKKAKTYPNFKSLVFPNDFLDYEGEFDVLLLINVLDIMPIPIERLCVLALCREKMKKNGRLLWYTQHGAYTKENAVTKLLDGLVTGKGRKYHMFYRDFSRKEIHEMLMSTGFSFNNKFKFPSVGGNQAYVFNADGDILVDKSLGLTSMLKKKKKTLKTIERKTRWKAEEKSKKIVYEAKMPTRASKLEEISILRNYLKEMLKITPGGGKKALRYQKLIFYILKIIFENRLDKPTYEEPIADGIKRVDITFKNRRKKGFFEELDSGYHLTCPNIFIECKNYQDDLKDREFTQIQGRLNNVRGQFGILICREIKDIDNIKKRQDDAIKKKEYVIVLEDTDIEKLVKYKLKNKEEEIDDFLEEKFKRLT